VNDTERGVGDSEGKKDLPVNDTEPGVGDSEGKERCVLLPGSR
jgi:hypothetical protein